jgi:hypothetical protein
MKNLMCPACSIPSVPFWRAYRRYWLGSPPLVCPACKRPLHHARGMLAAHLLLIYIPFVLGALFFVAAFPSRWVLLVPLAFAVTCLTVRYTRLSLVVRGR